MRAATHLFVLVFCLTLTGCGLFGDKEDEVKPSELVDFKSSVRIKKIWSANLGGGGEDLRLGLSPASNGARVFAASSEGRVYAFDALTGKSVWRIDTKQPLSAGPGTGANLVVVGSSGGTITALAADNGETLWQIHVNSELLATPAVGAGKVLVRTVDGRLLALDAANGDEVWEIQHRVQGLTLRGNAEPVIIADVVISGFDNGTVAAASLADGSIVWESAMSERRGRTELDRLADVDGRVAVVGEDVFVAGFQGSAALLSLVSGSPVWRQDLSSHQAIGLDWNRVYISRADDSIVALNRTSGVIEWSQDALAYRQISGPSVSQSIVVVGDYDGYLHWLDASDGHFVARTRAGGGLILSAPLVVGDLVLVQTTDGTLTAFRAAQPASG